MTKLLVQDFELIVDLDIEATWHKAQRGAREKGGLQLEPDEPAGWEIDGVTCRGTGILSALRYDDVERLLELLPEPEGPDPDYLRDRQRDERGE
jgi:hypothetical protein